jgi:hypothetical protein
MHANRSRFATAACTRVAPFLSAQIYDGFYCFTKFSDPGFKYGRALSLSANTCGTSARAGTLCSIEQRPSTAPRRVT